MCGCGAQTPMVSYVNVHAVLERRRRKARDAIAASDALNSQRVEANSPAVSSSSSITFLLLELFEPLGYPFWCTG